MESEGRRITSAANIVPRSINFRKELYVVVVVDVIDMVVDSSFGSIDRRRFFEVFLISGGDTCCTCNEDDGAGGVFDPTSAAGRLLQGNTRDEDVSRIELRRIIIEAKILSR